MTISQCSIIIRSYNEEKNIGQLLDGIFQQTIKDVEVILVDSGSTDNTLLIASGYPIKIIQIPPHEFTFGKSLNLGVQASSANLVVFASAHVFPVYPDWLEKLIIPFNNPKVALTFGKQRGAENTLFSEKQVFNSWYPDFIPEPVGNPFCNNANAAVRRELAIKYPYNETLPGLEDLDWAKRMVEHGYQICYVPEAEIIHVHHETPRGVINRYRREAIAFKHIYVHERFGLIDFVRLSTRNILNDTTYAWQQKVFLRSIFSIIWFRICQFWGTYQGYRYHGPLTWHLRQRFYYPNGVAPSDGKGTREITPIQYQDIQSYDDRDIELDQ